jgi:hypothetical protein
MLRREARLWYKSPSPMRLVLGLALFGTTASLAMAMNRRPAPLVIPVAQPMTTSVATPVPVLAQVPVVTETAEKIGRATRRDFGLVFESDGMPWLMLEDLGDDVKALPPHGKLRLVAKQEWSPDVFASVKPEDLPAAHQKWVDREVVVEGGCRARVKGFAIVSVLIGDVSYSGAEGKAWTAENVFDQGNRVLAAELDGCHGGYARDAALAPIAEGIVVDNPGLAGEAREKFLEAKEVEESLALLEEHPEAVVTKVVKHPVTGKVWVSVFAHYNEGCGGPQVDTWGLYGVDAKGNLQRERITKLEDISSIDRLIDVDGDGRFELVTSDWLGMSRLLRDEKGKTISELEIPFYGCPC